MNNKKKVIRAVTIMVLLSTLEVTSEQATVVEAKAFSTSGISAEISEVFSKSLENVSEKNSMSQEVDSIAGAGIFREISQTLRIEENNDEMKELELLIKSIREERPIPISDHLLIIMQKWNKANINSNSGIFREISEILRYVEEHSEELMVTPNPERTIVKCGNGRIYTKEEADYIIAKVAMVIHGEASVCDVQEKYGVGTVLMNRFERTDYPDSIDAVIRDGYDYLNYEDEEPTEEEWQIAREVVLNSIRVYDEDVVYQAKHPQGQTVDVSEWHYYGSEPLPEE